MSMSGIIIIDKPAGWTSHDVVAKLRGALRDSAMRVDAMRSDAMRSDAVCDNAGINDVNRKSKKAKQRIGHGGTLDPMATGVLPIFIGRATRAAEFCENAQKEYIAELRLGIVTDTQDITGTVLCKNEVTATYDDLVNALPRFKGQLTQIPPMYSAVKQGGKKLYELARSGVEVTRKARDIYISELDIMDEPFERTGLPDNTVITDAAENPDWLQENPLYRTSYTLRIVCSKGTYIRTLCHDIGALLGCGGTLSGLRRNRAGVYTIDMSHRMDEVLSYTLTDSVNEIMLPIDSIFSDYPSISICESDIIKVKNGAVCRTLSDTEAGKYKVYAPNGDFLLLGEVKNNTVHTIKSFFEIS